VRWRVLLLAAAAPVALAAATPAGAACTTSVQTVTCTVTGAVQTVVVPTGVERALVQVRGGAGAQDDEHMGPGGRAGIAEAVLPVQPGRTLEVYVARSGYQAGGGWGFADGGDHGTAPGWSLGYSGGDGGGASAVAWAGASAPLLVGGGGGGGGGNGAGDTHKGGAGGDGAGGGGPGDANGASGGTSVYPPYGSSTAGIGGDAPGAQGQGGMDANVYSLSFDVGAGGGGGGGYPNGGGGGTVYLPPQNKHWGYAFGGGGGGGGDSYAAPAAIDPVVRVSDSVCPRGGGQPGCDGLVAITWMATPATVLARGGQDQEVPVGRAYAERLQALVLADDGLPAIGADVTFALPADGPSATFDTGEPRTATVTTDEHGVATAPPMTANGVEGSWAATATVADVPRAARFPARNLPAATVTAVSAPAGAVAGQTVRLTAVVAGPDPALGTPSGSVLFELDDEPVGAVALDAAGVAESDPIALTAGDHEIAAAYLPEPPFAPSRAEQGLTVARATPVVTVTTDPNPSAVAEPVTLTAQVEAAPPSAGLEPTGLVRFSADGTPLGTATLDGGTASLTTDAMGTGEHEIVALYDGDDEVAPGTGTAVQAVDPDATAVTLSSSQRPSVYGDPPTLTAVLRAAAGDPVGTVSFSADGVPLCDGIAAQPQGGGESRATCTPAPGALAVGTRTIVAAFAPGTGDFLAGHGTIAQTVLAAPSTVALDQQPGETVFGESRELLATATSAGPATPSGLVRFGVDGVPFGDPVALSAIGAAITWPAPGGLPHAGAHVVTARYGGDPEHAPAQAQAIALVAPALTTLTLTSSADPAPAGTPVRFTAQVATAGPGPATVTGAVRFRVDGAPLGDPVPLAGGTATSPPIASLAPGSHDVQAAFTSPAGDFAPSRDALIQQVEGGGPAPVPAGPSGGGGGAPDAGPPGSAASGELPAAAGSGCRGRLLAITEVRRDGRHVRIAGIALGVSTERDVRITDRGFHVARTPIRAGGRFAVRVRAPRPGRRAAVRYRAHVDRTRTPAVRLAGPRIGLTGRAAARGSDVIATARLVPGRRTRLTLLREARCLEHRRERVRVVRTRRDGRARIALPRPAPDAGPVVYVLRHGRLASPAIVVGAD